MSDIFWARPCVNGRNQETYFVTTKEGQVFKWLTENGANKGFKSLDVTPAQVELVCDPVLLGHGQVFALSESWKRFRSQNL